MSGPTCPWDFTEPPSSLEAVENLPSDDPMIVKAGQDLAATAEEGGRRLVAKGLPRISRCDECAFTAGTVPNRSLLTLADATKCVVEGVPFMCHKGVDPGSRLCGGYVDAVVKLHAPRGGS